LLGETHGFNKFNINSIEEEEVMYEEVVEPEPHVIETGDSVKVKVNDLCAENEFI
jgi:hypothetical protein